MFDELIEKYFAQNARMNVSYDLVSRNVRIIKDFWERFSGDYVVVNEDPMLDTKEGLEGEEITMLKNIRDILSRMDKRQQEFAERD